MEGRIKEKVICTDSRSCTRTQVFAFYSKKSTFVSSCLSGIDVHLYSYIHTALSACYNKNYRNTLFYIPAFHVIRICPNDR